MSVNVQLKVSPFNSLCTCCLVPDIVIEHWAVHVAVAVPGIAVGSSVRRQPGLDVQEKLLY